MSDVLRCCDGLSRKVFQPGDFLTREGERSGVVYVLIDGEVEILRGDVQIDTSNLEGALFGEMSILLGRPHTATVKAIRATECFEVADLLGWVERNPSFSVHLCRLLAKRLNNVTTYLVDLKEQFADQGSHLNMVDEVLGTLLHHQDED